MVRVTWPVKVAWAVLGFLWVTAIIASADHAAGTAVAWWWVFLGGSTMSNLRCVATASLVLWQLAAPVGVAWRVAEAVGYAQGHRDAVSGAGNVVPLPRRQTAGS
jgi:hypothetical protein